MANHSFNSMTRHSIYFALSFMLQFIYSSHFRTSDVFKELGIRKAMLDQDETLKELYVNSHNMMVEISDKNQEKLEELENFHQVLPAFSIYNWDNE